MKIAKIHSFLVHPAKHADPQPPVKGTDVAQRGQLFTMLQNLFDSRRRNVNTP